MCARLAPFVGATAFLLAGCASMSQTAPERPFSAEYAPPLAQPEVVIENVSSDVITVKLEGPETKEWSVPPKDKVTAALPAGHYSYLANGPNVSQSGDQQFQPDYRYRWVFRPAARRSAGPTRTRSSPVGLSRNARQSFRSGTAVRAKSGCGCLP